MIITKTRIARHIMVSRVVHIFYFCRHKKFQIVNRTGVHW